MNVTVIPHDPTEFPETWAALPPTRINKRACPIRFPPSSRRNRESGSSTFTADRHFSRDRNDDRTGILAALFAHARQFCRSRHARSFAEVTLTGGNDGLRPTARVSRHRRAKDRPENFRRHRRHLDRCRARSTFGYENGYRNNGQHDHQPAHLACAANALSHRRARLWRRPDHLATCARCAPEFDSTYAALYYPWVRVLDPVTRQEIHLPPSGFVAGIYARNDINRAVYKAPANEVVNLRLGFE